MGVAKNVNEMFAFVKERIGRLDVLVNNAGIIKDNYLMLMDEKNWRDVIRTNLDSVYHCSKVALKLLATNKKGTIINISSASGLVPNVGQTNYSASKAGVIAFTKALAKEVVRNGITVNAIAPGYVETEMTVSMNEKTKNQWIDKILMKRFAKPEGIAKLSVFLASDDARYITGQCIVIDGGLIC